ncbi:hypothetical protein Godav_021327 [Gossypium davidsonii]|uniref:Uncharacterized protein n=1 Tax=Gossypium davidsonii TaxID=34287 RepID=A0A7J8R6A2_GOSDV|nr:hypothetical protein [Gossypium davidsonii]
MSAIRDLRGNTDFASSPTRAGRRGRLDGDRISIFGSQKKIGVDHCLLSYCIDGLVDAVTGSTGITIRTGDVTDRIYDYGAQYETIPILFTYQVSKPKCHASKFFFHFADVAGDELVLVGILGEDYASELGH